MDSAVDFWHRYLGRHLKPDAKAWKEALMSGYPHFQRGRSVRMGGSEPARFLITKDRAYVWAPVAPDVDLPDHVVIRPTSDRKRRDWIVDVILNPPSEPFLAASVGMSSADAEHWRITTSRDLIAIGGSPSLFEGEAFKLIDRDRFVTARDWFKETKTPIKDLVALHYVTADFKSNRITGVAARARRDRLKTPLKQLLEYPGDPDLVTMKLANFAATDWTKP